jgi:hypothetical protein
LQAHSCGKGDPEAGVFRVLVRVAVLALTLIGIAHARAEPPSVSRAQILWAGQYEAITIGHIVQPHTAVGQTNELANTRKLKATTTVEGRLGASFGVEYALVGKPAGAAVPVSIVVVLPKEGLKNPQRAERTFIERWLPAPKWIGSTTIVGYTFDHAWEIVPGLWTFEIWSDDQKLGEQAFCVVTERPPEGDKSEPCKSVPIT